MRYDFKLNPLDILVGVVTFLLLFAYIAIYKNGVAGFPTLDDNANILSNYMVMDAKFTWSGLVSAANSFNDISGQMGLPYRPISYLSFALNSIFFDDVIASIKAVNIVIHLANGILVFCLGVQLLRLPLFLNPPVNPDVRFSRAAYALALIAAFGWLFHPLMVSSVLYAVQRMTLLSAFFSLITINLFVYYRISLATRGTGYWAVFFSVLSGTVLAFFSKENGILTPLFCGVIELCRFRNQFSSRVPDYLRKLANLLLIACPAVIIVWLSIRFYYSYDIVSPNRNFSVLERFLTQFRVLSDYVQWILLPSNQDLVFIYDNYQPGRGLFEPVQTFFHLVIWCSLIVFSFALVKLQKFAWVAFAILWFVSGHLIESSVIPLELVFEHRNYMPYVGLFIGGCGAVCGLLEKTESRHSVVAGRVVIAGMLVVLVAYPAVKTYERVQYWSSEESLVTHWMRTNSLSPRLWEEVANYAYKNKNADAAYNALESARKLKPGEEGYGYMQLGLLCSFSPDAIEEANLKIQETIASVRALPTTSYSKKQFINLIRVCDNQAFIERIEPLLVAVAEEKQLAAQTIALANLLLATVRLNQGDSDAVDKYLADAKKTGSSISDLVSIDQSEGRWRLSLNIR
ncbi:MAG: hypothetical protein CR963_00510 [Gammaproteobacteria bacterium]|nr:MAG: hypothetical protein CR963_00510 [Gammaproteobacteria bacterium]